MIEIPQVRHIDKVVDCPAVQVVQTAKQTVESAVDVSMLTQSPSSSRWAEARGGCTGAIPGQDCRRTCRGFNARCP